MRTLSYNKSKIRFLLLEGIHKSAIDTLKEHGYENITHLPATLPEKDLEKELRDVHFLGIRSRTKLTSRLLSSAEKLIGIGCFCIGTDQVDLSFTASAGIPVFNAPYSNTRSVAELVLGEAILLLRSIPEKNCLAHQGKWSKSAKNSYEIRGKTLGIVGYGNIGMQLGSLAESVGMNVCFYDVAAKLPMGNAKAMRSLENLLSVSDVISLHVPDTPETRGMADDTFFSMMKKNAVLINASRGKTVSLEALKKALESGNLMGAAIDVFPVEPSSNNDMFSSPLQGMNNVILTPHIGGSTQEAQENIGREVAEKLITFCDNGSTLMAVNFPEVSLPAHPGRHRILHIHQNMPGVLMNINHVFSENHVNISSQFLQTQGDTGYVVTDIETSTPNLYKSLKQVPGTIRVRLLF